MRSVVPREFTATARTLHWVIAGLVLSQFVTNWLRAAALHGSAFRGLWLQVHMSVGVTVFLLTLVRIGWRYYAPPPPPLTTSTTARRLAQSGHGLLYLLTFAVPVTGFMRQVAGGRPARIFGLSVPSPFGHNPGLRHLMVHIHGSAMEYIFLALIAGHAAAALWHQFVLQDGTLARMAWPSRWRQSLSFSMMGTGSTGRKSGSPS